MGTVDWTTTAALIGMSIVLVCTTAVCVLVAVWANYRADQIRGQRDTVAMRAAAAMREVEVERALRAKAEADGQRRTQRWRSAYIELRMQALEAVRVFGWHAEDLPREPLDTVMDDLIDTIPGEGPA